MTSYFISSIYRSASRVVLALFFMLCAFPALRGSEPTPPPFEYPVVPEDMNLLNERANFYLENFWNKANFKSLCAEPAALQQAFRDFCIFIPYADSNVVHSSIDKLIKNVEKNPNNLLAVAEVAENNLYGDSAQILCDECYLHFAKAVALNKKISAADKARFEYQATALEGSMVGMNAPDFRFTQPDGLKSSLADIPRGPYILLFINDPDCDECNMARIRLSADHNLNTLLEQNHIKVLSIYPGEYSQEWAASTDTYNPLWIVGAAPEIDKLYDLRHTPSIYYLNGKHVILSKTFDIDSLLEAFRVVRNKISPIQ